jgi:hypothetical protein
MAPVVVAAAWAAAVVAAWAVAVAPTRVPDEVALYGCAGADPAVGCVERTAVVAQARAAARAASVEAARVSVAGAAGRRVGTPSGARIADRQE